jgi:UDP-2-acetamido-2,6-beta-L-arabino-hexul-4-ose reductase
MSFSNRNILITGAKGFVGKNLALRLNELKDFNIFNFGREDDTNLLPEIISQVDTVVHLAGENRPDNQNAFNRVNFELTLEICNLIRQEYKLSGRHIPLVLASSIHAESNNPYGLSKYAAERAVISLAEETNNPCIIYRFPGIFGKWAKPYYNSVVATFCYRVAHNLPIQVSNENTSLSLVHIDDVISSILNSLKNVLPGCKWHTVEPVYTVTLRELADYIHSFNNCRENLMIPQVGRGFLHKLYSTYISYLSPNNFYYHLKEYNDSRGIFVEFLKTPTVGQFSFFTINPGFSRGGHYHHTKTEKFLVIAGEALFRFRNLLTYELVELKTSGQHPKVVDTIPGWTHDIINIGIDKVVAMLWANENFNSDQPDTIPKEI